MTSRQFCTPHLLASGSAQRLLRVPFQDNGFGESFYQKLLLDHPLLLPVDEIEPLFAPLLPLAREVQTTAGPVDVLYISSEGYLTLVETKLWRNPEARRQVVAQIIDYATALSRWTYEQLRDAVKKAQLRDPANKPGAMSDDPLIAVAMEQPDFDKARFIDTVSRNLTKGRFLLLIVGDGIQEGVEHLADTLSRSPHLSFSLALVELGLFRASDASESLFIQPRVLARTREVVRAVVEVRAPSKPADVAISLPDLQEGADGSRRGQPAEEVFAENLAKATSPAIAGQFRDFLRKCEEIGIKLEGKGQTVGLRWFEPNTGDHFTFGTVYANGAWIEVKWIQPGFERAGIDASIAVRYVTALAALVPGARVEPDRQAGRTYLKIMRNGSAITLREVLPRVADWLKALETAIAETEAAASNKSAQ